VAWGLSLVASAIASVPTRFAVFIQVLFSQRSVAKKSTKSVTPFQMPDPKPELNEIAIVGNLV
jgi:hypothetical protein